MPTISDRLALLESAQAEGHHPGIRFAVDGLVAESYQLKIGGDVVETISRDSDESHESFEGRASDRLAHHAHAQRKARTVPIMWPVMPEIKESCTLVSPATGEQIKVTIGGER